MSLFAVVAALVLADFGAPAWMFILLGLWLCTGGLPTLLAVLLVAGLWGRLPWIGMPSLTVALVVAAVVALAFQMATCVVVSRLVGRGRNKRDEHDAA